MTIYDALKKMRVDEAAKRQSWGGYIKKTEATSPNTGYNLVFKKRDGSEKTYNVSSLGVITTSSAETIDPELLNSIMSNDWTVDTVEAYESARSGSGVW